MKAIDKLTLAELEAIAKRMETAARTIRDSMALVGGPQPFSAQAILNRPSQPRLAEYQEVQGPPQPNPLINSDDTDPRARRPPGAPDLPPKTEAMLEKEAERKLFLASRRAEKQALLQQFDASGEEVAQ